MRSAMSISFFWNPDPRFPTLLNSGDATDQVRCPSFFQAGNTVGRNVPLQHHISRATPAPLASTDATERSLIADRRTPADSHEFMHAPFAWRCGRGAIGHEFVGDSTEGNRMPFGTADELRYAVSDAVRQLCRPALGEIGGSPDSTLLPTTPSH